MFFNQTQKDVAVCFIHDSEGGTGVMVLENGPIVVEQGERGADKQTNNEQITISMLRHRSRENDPRVKFPLFL